MLFKLTVLRRMYLQYRLDRLNYMYNKFMLEGRVVEAYDLYPKMFSYEDKINSL